ncbi:hypothetical protein HXX76_015090 [Chlamydomonas incerta]|uniref:Threonylcarbamoyl-AMP synthase n=1 Tax=Chlamydomonas incerta TaxID=51695 RepID=A0A835VQ68_CHLIN|nr:hypothetical protein HXX76_015090 [Chlamydomonas incerta]|eukprot:KAG2423700.1 hypothetical protein HXX76_015090 [Chlamydomonas incerta]
MTGAAGPGRPAGSSSEQRTATEVLVVPLEPYTARGGPETASRAGEVASTSGRASGDAATPLVGHLAIARAAAMLAAGDVVAIPTETVYGLAANALSAEAVGRVYAAKKRPADNPLIIHVSSLAMLAALYPPGWTLPPIYQPLLRDLWPGPLTVLLPRSPLVPDAVTCGLPTMAVRMPAHPVALALIAACGFPLAAPSANSSGRPSPTLARHVAADLGGGVIPLILDGGACSCGVESTVLDALRSPPAILRPGGVTREDLMGYPGLEALQVYRKDFTDAALEAAPTTPGMKYRHYSPTAPVILLDPSAPAATASAAVATANGAGRNHSGNGSCDVEGLAARLRQATKALLAEMAHGIHEGGAPAPSGSAGPAAAPAGPASGHGPGAAGLSPAVDGGASGSSVPLGPPALELASQLAGGGPVGVLRTSLAGEPPGLLQQRAPATAAAGVGANGQADGAGGGSSRGAPAPQRVIEYVLGHVLRPADVAAELFAGLRALDEAGCAVIVVEGVADEGAGVAVMNRLRKAASRVVHV